MLRFAMQAEMRTLIADMSVPVLALNCVGGPSATELTRLIGQKGVMVTYGGMAKLPVTATNSAFIFKDITLRGFWLSRWIKEHSEAERLQMLNTLTVLFRKIIYYCDSVAISRMSNNN